MWPETSSELKGGMESQDTRNHGTTLFQLYSAR